MFIRNILIKRSKNILTYNYHKLIIIIKCVGKIIFFKTNYKRVVISTFVNKYENIFELEKKKEKILIFIFWIHFKNNYLLI